MTHKSGLASILLKKSPATGFRELINLFKTISVSTLKYCVYDEILKTPLQLFAVCSSNASAWMEKPEIYHYKFLSFEMKIQIIDSHRFSCVNIIFFKDKYHKPRPYAT